MRAGLLGCAIAGPNPADPPSPSAAEVCTLLATRPLLDLPALSGTRSGLESWRRRPGGALPCAGAVANVRSPLRSRAARGIAHEWEVDGMPGSERECEF